jgi:hypothetical protein
VKDKTALFCILVMLAWSAVLFFLENKRAMDKQQLVFILLLLSHAFAYFLGRLHAREDMEEA